MRAIVMAGGLGTRLRSVYREGPKPMIPVLGEPVLGHVLHWLAHNGVGRARAALGYRAEDIRQHFGDGAAYGLRLSYSVERQALGTAGAVARCGDFFQDRDFLVVSGDGVCDFDLRALMECHRRHGAAVTMALAERERPMGCGLVVTDRRHRVRGFIEKPDWSRVVTDRVNTGIYAVSPRAMAYVPPGEPFDFAKDLFPRLMEAEETLLGLPMPGYWCDIGTPKAYYRCNLDALEGRVRLYGSPPAPEEPESAPRPEEAGALLIPCGSRARLMRALTENLMEAGAALTDGLRLPDAHIFPAAAQEALCIRAADPKVRARYEWIAKTLDKNA